MRYRKNQDGANTPFKQCCIFNLLECCVTNDSVLEYSISVYSFNSQHVVSVDSVHYTEPAY